MARAPRMSRTTRWLLTVGALAILLITAYVMYDRQQKEQVQLEANIAQAELQLAAYKAPDPTEKAELEARLDKANSRLAGIRQLQDKFRTHTQSIEINEAVFDAAEETNVAVTRIGASPPGEEELRGFVFRVFSLTVVAESEVPPELINFSMKLSEAFPTARIESVSMDVPKPAEDGTIEGNSILDLKLRIYFYE